MFLSAFNSRFRSSLSSNTRGWLICLVVLLLMITRSGITYSFGLFVQKLESEHNQTAMAVQNWIGTLSLTISMSTSPISALVIRSLGQNGYQIATAIGVTTLAASFLLSSVVVEVSELWMFLTYSVLNGFGSSISFMSSSLAIAEYFDKEHKHHVLATSILKCGYPVGSLLFNPIYGWLIESYGVPVALRVGGCLMLLIGLPSCLVFVSKLDNDTNEPIDYGDCRKRMHSCWNQKQFIVRPEIFLWLLGNLLLFCAYFMPFVNLAYYMKLKNIGLSQSKWVLTLLSLVECFIYIIASLVGDYIKGKLIIVNIISSVGLSILCFVWPFVDSSYWTILVMSALFGGNLALTMVFQFAASAEVTKLPIDAIWPATNFWAGLGNLIGPAFSGGVFDIRHSYDDVWFVCGGLYLAQVLIFTAIPVIWICRGGSFNPDDYTEIKGDTVEDSPIDNYPMLNVEQQSEDEGLAIDSKKEG